MNEQEKAGCAEGVGTSSHSER